MTGIIIYFPFIKANVIFGMYLVIISSYLCMASYIYSKPWCFDKSSNSNVIQWLHVTTNVWMKLISLQQND